MTASLSALDAGFVFAVTGAAMLWPWLALIVAAAWMVALFIEGERRAKAAATDAA